jgi:hypothetical protein
MLSGDRTGRDPQVGRDRSCSNDPSSGLTSLSEGHTAYHAAASQVPCPAPSPTTRQSTQFEHPRCAVWGASTIASAAASGWIQRPPKTHRPEVASRAGNATPAAPYSAIGMQGRVAPTFRDPTTDAPHPSPTPFRTTCRRPHRGWTCRSPPDASRRNGALMARTPLSLVPRAPRVIARMLHAEAAGGTEVTGQRHQQVGRVMIGPRSISAPRWPATMGQAAGHRPFPVGRS